MDGALDMRRVAARDHRRAAAAQADTTTIARKILDMRNTCKWRASATSPPHLAATSFETPQCIWSSGRAGHWESRRRPLRCVPAAAVITMKVRVVAPGDRLRRMQMEEGQEGQV
jgi:phage tail sheath gpL-like